MRPRPAQLLLAAVWRRVAGALALLALGGCGGSSSSGSSTAATVSGASSAAAHAGTTTAATTTTTPDHTSTIVRHARARSPTRGTGGAETNDDNPGGADTGKQSVAQNAETRARW